MMRELKSFLKCFYAPEFYADVVQNWKGIGMGFIMLLAFMDFVTLAIPMGRATPALQQGIMELAVQMPKVIISEGHLSIDHPTPYLIQQGGKNAVLFDMSDSAKDLTVITKKMDQEKLPVFVNSEFIAYKKSDTSLEIQRFDKHGLKNIIIDHDHWLDFASAVVKWGAVIIIVVLALCFIIGVFVITFIKSFLVKLAALFFKTKPDFAASMRLAAAAAIPPVFLLSAYTIAQPLITPPPTTAELAPHNLPGYLSTLIWAGYVLFGLWSINRAPKATHI